MNAVWKCPKCGAVCIEKDLPNFKIYDETFLYGTHTGRSKLCGNHRENVYMRVKAES